MAKFGRREGLKLPWAERSVRVRPPLRVQIIYSLMLKRISETVCGNHIK